MAVSGPKPPLHTRRALTRNRMGWVSHQMGPASALFVEFCQSHPGSPVLDIGSAYAAAALAALQAGVALIAVDLDPEHLHELVRRAGPGARLTVQPARFPRDTHFAPASLAAVHASNVFHFLTGRQLEHGFRVIENWLQPGGKLFVQAASPYQQPFAAFLPEYQRRLDAGLKWPGFVESIGAWSTHRKISLMPRAVHLLDDSILARTAVAAGLEVERSWLYRGADLSPSLFLDGRESAGLVARKPVH